MRYVTTTLKDIVSMMTTFYLQTTMVLYIESQIPRFSCMWLNSEGTVYFVLVGYEAAK